MIQLIWFYILGHSRGAEYHMFSVVTYQPLQSTNLTSQWQVNAFLLILNKQNGIK